MTAGRTRHGSSASRGRTRTRPSAAEVPLPRSGTSPGASGATLWTTPPAPRAGDGGPQPVGLDEILHVDDGDGDGDDDCPGGTPADRAGPVAVRRPDLLAGPLLLLAGVAAGVSLLVVWVHGGDAGLDLVAVGLRDAREGAGTLAGTGSWPPLAVVGGGAASFVLGLLMYVPARTHRFLGALALLVSAVVAAGVLVPLSEADWDTAGWAVGAWCAVAVGGLGLLGALEALSAGPRHR
jgi:hypothetical protein